ncbi:MAG: hypothetical protein ABJA69_03305 [Acidobacteriaceae bacterium]
MKLQFHNELLATIPNSKHVFVPNSWHYIQNDAHVWNIEESSAALAKLPP